MTFIYGLNRVINRTEPEYDNFNVLLSVNIELDIQTYIWIEIRDKKIEREEGIALVKKYDHEFPHKYYKEFLDFTGIDDEEFNEIIDSWRSDHIWKKDGDKWVLRNPIWK